MLLLFLLMLAIFTLASHTTHVVIDHLLRPNLEAFLLQLVVLDQLVGADVVDGPLVGNVFAHLVEVLLDSLVDLRKAFGSDRG